MSHLNGQLQAGDHLRNVATGDVIKFRCYDKEGDALLYGVDTNEGRRWFFEEELEGYEPYDPPPKPPPEEEDEASWEEPQHKENCCSSKDSNPISARFKAINDFVDCTMRDLTRVEVAVWLVLWRDSRKGIARTAETELARKCGYTRRATISEALRSLVAKGLVTVVCQGGLGRKIGKYRVQPLPPD